MNRFSASADWGGFSEPARPGRKVLLVALLVGLAVSWPLLYAALAHGPDIVIRTLTGDSYHYLAIARNAVTSHMYTYDGVHVTNGFHPLWQYFIRGMFVALDIRSHEGQAIAVVFASLTATTAGTMLASAAIIRMTNRYFLGLLVVPGLFYLIVGVHVRVLPIWSALDGMESGFSILFGGTVFFVMSRHFRIANRGTTAGPIELCRALGLILPFLILSRLDDVFILPAFLIAIALIDCPVRTRIRAGLWLAGPSSIAILAYLVYNKATVGAAMPLSGGTKAGFVGFVSTYLTAAVHMPAILDLKALVTKTASDGGAIFSASLRFIEMIYPLLASVFGALAILKYKNGSPYAYAFFAICLYILIKEAYNFLYVHPWHQSAWYYAFIALSLSVLGAVALRDPWSRLKSMPIVRTGVIVIYLGITLLAASQYYALIVYQNSDTSKHQFWNRKNEIRSELVAHGVHGIINVDDGISVFLLDMPAMHGFAFAPDVEAQKAHKSGRMLSLAYSRHIDAIVGFGYMTMDLPPQTDAQIREYLSHSLAREMMYAEMDKFEFSLAYFDPVLKLPFFSFRPKTS